jgi:hypothetical protein
MEDGSEPEADSSLKHIYVEYLSNFSGLYMSGEKKQKVLRRTYLLLIIVAVLSVTLILALWSMRRVQTDFNNYVESHHYTDYQYLAPKLIANLSYTVNDKARDIWISGVVYNVGFGPAFNSTVGIYGNTNPVSFEIHKSISLGIIGPYGSAFVNTHVNYSDSAVLGAQYSWDIQPEWTENP